MDFIIRSENLYYGIYNLEYILHFDYFSNLHDRLYNSESRFALQIVEFKI